MDKQTYKALVLNWVEQSGGASFTAIHKFVSSLDIDPACKTKGYLLNAMNSSSNRGFLVTGPDHLKKREDGIWYVRRSMIYHIENDAKETPTGSNWRKLWNKIFGTSI